jgi:hypothetical protein
MPVQLGEETQTDMGSFLLCGDEQLHDLHSKLRLEHPRGTANQLHKCAAPFPLQPFCTANCSFTTTFIIDMYPSGKIQSICNTATEIDGVSCDKRTAHGFS